MKSTSLTSFACRARCGLTLVIALGSCSSAFAQAQAESVGIQPCPSFCGGAQGTLINDFHTGVIGVSAMIDDPLYGNGRCEIDMFANQSIRAESFAASNARVISEVVGQIGYFYDGTVPKELEFTIGLSGTASGEAQASATLGVILGDQLAFEDDPGTLYNEIVAGNPDLTLLGRSDLSLPVDAGFQTVQDTLVLVLQPGDKIYVHAWMRTIATRGGVADAYDTLSFSIDDPTGLVVDVPCLGDANFSGTVDFADITDVLGNWQADYSPGIGLGDADGNGEVNFTDVTTVLGNWLALCDL